MELDKTSNKQKGKEYKNRPEKQRLTCLHSQESHGTTNLETLSYMQRMWRGLMHAASVSRVHKGFDDKDLEGFVLFVPFILTGSYTLSVFSQQGSSNSLEPGGEGFDRHKQFTFFYCCWGSELGSSSLQSKCIWVTIKSRLITDTKDYVYCRR